MASLPPTVITIDDPIEMLEACHERVRRFAALAGRIAEHVQTYGADTQAREAAHSVLRYFNLAAPLHHADEDDDLYPALRELNLPDLNQRLAAITAEHDELALLWQAVSAWLSQIEAGQPTPPPDCLPEFVQRYPEHAIHEERWIYPHAKKLPASRLAAIARAMSLRRQT